MAVADYILEQVSEVRYVLYYRDCAKDKESFRVLVDLVFLFTCVCVFVLACE